MDKFEMDNFRAVELAKRKGMERAEAGTPQYYRERALNFLFAYASKHRYFNGGDVLAAWRKTADPIAQQDWRNRWGPVMSTAAKHRWIVWAGRVRPVSEQSHSRTLVLWQSQICPRTAEPERLTDAGELERLRLAVEGERTSIARALKSAYELGIEVR